MENGPFEDVFPIELKMEIFHGYVSLLEGNGSWRDPFKWYCGDGNQKSGINSPVEGTVVEIPLFNQVLAPYQVVALGISEPSKVVAHDTPPKINIEPEVMMVWFRWFSFSNGGILRFQLLIFRGVIPLWLGSIMHGKQLEVKNADVDVWNIRFPKNMQVWFPTNSRLGS